MPDLKVFWRRVFLLAFLAMAFAWTACLYSNRLAVPAHDNTFRFDELAGPAGHNALAKQGPASQADELREASAPVPDGTIRINKTAAQSRTMLSHMVRSVAADRSKLLWTMYPASIRGRVFTASAVAADPQRGGGGW